MDIWEEAIQDVIGTEGAHNIHKSKQRMAIILNQSHETVQNQCWLARMSRRWYYVEKHIFNGENTLY